MNTIMNAINWPKEYLPGLTDNYASNEVIVKGITVEELDYSVVRILTQETQVREPAKALYTAKPNPMINGHQDWLDSLVSAAKSYNK